MFTTIYNDKLASRSKTSVRKLTDRTQKVNLDFSSNDYLGFNKNQCLLSGGLEACRKYGIGSTGSRLLSGNNDLFMQFESEIATCKNTESALIFNSGFQCNAFVLSSLLDQKTLKCKPVVFFDRLNHSSLYQAVFLSGATLIRYKHNNFEHLSNLISSNEYSQRPKFIVTETVFGMDGDIINLKQLANIARKYNALLYLDEAHATGVIGENGYGLSTTVDLSGITAVVMGTFSKALGSSGAYIASDKSIINYLINFCPGFIYSTANSPFVIGAAQEAWRLLPSIEFQRKNLIKNSDYLRREINKIGLDHGNSTTNIVPIIIGEEDSTEYVAQKLMTNGIKVSCIKPPTVPPGTSRIRIAICIHHSKKDIDQLVEVLKCIKIKK